MRNVARSKIIYVRVAKKYCALSLMKYAIYVLWSRKYGLKRGMTITQKLRSEIK